MTLFSAADYIVCFVPDALADNTPDDRSVYLAPASNSSPTDADLQRVRGSWSASDGALFFAFVVPDLEPGGYTGYVRCADDRLEGTTNDLLISNTPDTATSPVDGSAGRVWWIALIACVAFLVALGRLGAQRDAGSRHPRRAEEAGPEPLS